MDGCKNQAPINVVAEYYNDKKSLSQADHLSLVAGQTQNLGDVTLDIGAIITGHVTDGGGIPLPAMWVSSYDTQGYSAGNLTLTNTTGDYSLNGLPIGGAKIRFSRSPFAAGYYAAEYYNDKPSFGSGDVLATQSGVTIPNVNAQLTNGGMISGNVSNGQGTRPDRSGAALLGPGRELYARSAPSPRTPWATTTSTTSSRATIRSFQRGRDGLCLGVVCRRGPYAWLRSSP